MEPIDAAPMVEYVLAGVDARRICARGFVALAEMARKGQRLPDEGQGIAHLEVWSAAGQTWRITPLGHFAYPAIEIERSRRAAVTRTVCAYGGGMDALDFTASRGFSPDDMRTDKGRWERLH